MKLNSFVKSLLISSTTLQFGTAQEWLLAREGASLITQWIFSLQKDRFAV